MRLASSARSVSSNEEAERPAVHGVLPATDRGHLMGDLLRCRECMRPIESAAPIPICSLCWGRWRQGRLARIRGYEPSRDASAETPRTDPVARHAADRYRVAP